MIKDITSLFTLTAYNYVLSVIFTPVLQVINLTATYVSLIAELVVFNEPTKALYIIYKTFFSYRCIYCFLHSINHCSNLF
ncbi:uncharacterized protein BX663DRAFT_519156 [Cokeromyces recurvatus]|uniref:uncharacterized protein n=1 Tax=Cokeromyces recurvatus TaxID=90255 RepID=UPI00221E9F86|nr:uncharacterized protein BX663DRAFT_519156 [Cokeromyces recurvatus]KAI7899970.1 hypothetical protein BX663DRAFT_519156 [Cokeromyces recurvatus]